jgi:hypothetical protein
MVVAARESCQRSAQTSGATTPAQADSGSVMSCARLRFRVNVDAFISLPSIQITIIKTRLRT